MHRPSSAWQVKRPLFVSGLIAVAVTAIALTASLAVTMGCVVPLIVLLYRKRLRLCAVIALCFLLVAVGYRHTYVLPAEQLNGQTDVIKAEVLEMPTYGRMYTVRITDSAYLPKDSRVMLRCPDDHALNIGDRFTAEADLLPVKDNQTYYASHLAFACAFSENEEDSLQITYASNREDGVLSRIRATLVNEPRTTLPPRESGLLAALCFGETGFVAEVDNDRFRSSGLNHLLVVSGLHLSMVALAIRRLVHRLGRYPRSLLTLCTVWLFALFVGATPSILRAATMISVWLIGGLLFQQSDGLNSLGLAAMILLAINPYTLWNIGFQLSFAATLGVLVMMPRLMPRKRTADDLPWWQQLWRWVRDSLLSVAAVSFSALLFTLPVACYHYGGFPVTTLPANFLAVPAAGAAMLFGWLGSLCGLIPFLGWLSRGLFAVAGLLIRYMAEIARLLSLDKAWATVSQQWQWLLLVGICILIVGSVLWRVSRKRMGVVLLTLILLTIGVGIPFSTAPIRMTIVPVDNEGGFILQQGKHCALLVTDARDINEITYDTPAFEPDVLIALAGDASVLTQLTRWPQATVVVATPTDWTNGIPLPLTTLPVGGTVTLWEGCRLTRLTDGWTLLHVGNETVCIGTDPKEPCPYPDGWHIYVGGAPTTPDRPYTVLCNDTWLRRHGHTVTGQATLLYDQPITFTPQRGEWRTTLWL